MSDFLLYVIYASFMIITYFITLEIVYCADCAKLHRNPHLNYDQVTEHMVDRRINASSSVDENILAQDVRSM